MEDLSKYPNKNMIVVSSYNIGAYLAWWYFQYRKMLEYNTRCPSQW